MAGGATPPRAMVHPARRKMLRQQASLRAGARGQPRSGRSSTTALARREQMSHGLMLQHGKCSVQKAPTFVMAWEQQGFQEKHTAATAKGYGCPQAPPEHCHNTAVPGRGQGGALLPSSLPGSMDWHCWDAHHARWLLLPQTSPMDANALYFHMQAKRIRLCWLYDKTESPGRAWVLNHVFPEGARCAI